MKTLWTSIALFAITLGFQAQAAEQEVQAKSLAELLQLVKDGKVVNARVNERREQAFVADKSRQQGEVRKAQREQANEEARSERLEAQFERKRAGYRSKAGNFSETSRFFKRALWCAPAGRRGYARGL